MNPLSQALMQRRSNSMSQGSPSGNAPAAGAQDPLVQLVASLAPEQKQKLMEMLQADSSAKSDGAGDQVANESGKIEDEAGETKMTAGEEAALQSEGTPMDECEDDAQPKSLRSRISQSIQKHLKK